MTQQEYENKIKELQDELEQLKAAKIEAEQLKCWKPNKDELYWTIISDGCVDCICWYNDGDDKWRRLTGNCFKTKEEAEEYKNQIEYTARYKNYIEEHSEPLDWENDEQYKYFAGFIFDEGYGINVNFVVTRKDQGVIYASRREIIWDAIKEIGEDNFKKYVLGVK